MNHRTDALQGRGLPDRSNHAPSMSDPTATRCEGAIPAEDSCPEGSSSKPDLPTRSSCGAPTQMRKTPGVPALGGLSCGEEARPSGGRGPNCKIAAHTSGPMPDSRYLRYGVELPLLSLRVEAAGPAHLYPGPKPARQPTWIG